MSFSLQRRQNELVFRTASLVARTEITPTFQRLRLQGSDLFGFDSPGADDHIRVFFPQDAAPAPATPEEWRANPSREYTPLAWDRATGTLDLEFVVHDDDGIAGRWARHPATRRAR